MVRNTEGNMHDIRIALADARASSGGGFASLVVIGTMILSSGVIAFFVSARAAALVLLLLGALAVPAALALERLLGFPRMAKDNPLRPLVIQLAMGKVVAFFAAVVAYMLNPALVATAFAAIVGGYYLPFAWMHGTRIYIVLGVIVGAAPWLMMVLAGIKSYPYVLLFWGTCDWIAAFLIRQEFRRRQSQTQTE